MNKIILYLDNKYNVSNLKTDIKNCNILIFYLDFLDNNSFEELNTYLSDNFLKIFHINSDVKDYTQLENISFGIFHCDWLFINNDHWDTIEKNFNPRGDSVDEKILFVLNFFSLKGIVYYDDNVFKVTKNNKINDYTKTSLDSFINIFVKEIL